MWSSVGKMNVQAHMSGQIPGQLSSQAGSQLPGIPQNVVPISSQMQSLGSLQGSWRADPDIDSIRNRVAEQILNVFGRSPPANERKLADMTKKLEIWLFKAAASKEEYMDTNTLQPRIATILNRMSAGGNRNQQLGHLNSSSVGTMIGMAHSGNANSMVSSMDSTLASGTNSSLMVPNPVGVGSLLPTANGSIGGMQRNCLNSSDGLLPNGYQQPLPSISVGSGSNLSSLAMSRHSSQMIPTPGLNDSHSLSMNTSNGRGFSSVDSVMASQIMQPRQYISSQHGHIMHNVGGMGMGMGMGMGIRSSMQPKPAGYGFPSGVLNGSLGTVGCETQLMNGAAPEGYISSPAYMNSQKPLQHHFNQQHQQQLIHNGDGFTNNGSDVSGSGDIFGSSGLNQSVNPLGFQSNLRANSMLQSHPSNIQSLQRASSIKSQSIDQSMKMLSSSHSKDHLFHSQQLQHQHQHQQQRVQQQHYSQYPRQSLAQFAHPHQQGPLHQQHQESLKDQTLRQSQFPSHAQPSSTAVCHILPEHEVESRNEALHHQILDQYQLSNLQNEYQSNLPMQDYSKGSQLVCQSSSSQELQSPLMQTSHKFQQLVQSQKQVSQSQNEFASLSVQSEIPVTEEWYATAEVKASALSQSSAEQLMQGDFRQRVMQQDGAQRPHPGTQGPTNGKMISPDTLSGLQCSLGAISRSGGQILRSRKKEIIDQQRWLLFLRHAKKCSALEGKCIDGHCVIAQNLCRHIDKCHEVHCKYTYCCTTKRLLGHFNRCHSGTCALCGPVRRWISWHKVSASSVLDCTQATSTNGTWKLNPVMELTKVAFESANPTFETSEGSSMKRVKLEHSSSSVVQPRGEPTHSSPLEEPDKQLQRSHQPYAPIPTKSDVMDVKVEQPVKYPLGSLDKVGENSGNEVDNSGIMKPEVQSQISNPSVSVFKQEHVPLKKEVEPVRQETKQETCGSTIDHVAGIKSGKPAIKGVSMTELFTPEQVREHIISLRQWVGQSKAKAEKNQAMEQSMSENSCQLCAIEKLTFEPPPIYCSLCGARIKRNAMYYTTASGDTRHYFCIPCYNESRGDIIEVDGTALLKAKMEKKKNDEEAEEWWVQCDKCEAWQHQICALFNGRRNDGGQAEYTCPNCYIAEVERGERKPLSQSAVLGAKDLPRTILSDHIEQRLFRRLKHERQERARSQSKSIDEVLGPEGLVVRVVSSVDKKLEVKQRYLEIFQEDNYPAEYPYKSKAVLLFQKIEGVEVCLFGMYVQEFGSECQLPNQRRVYLSYLDSVKYFRPEIKAVTGEALRTFVYHEILIGYLEYCKKRGFTSCYIWACPPLKGEDYILYCHPEIQKTPKSDKLREWYLSMLRKAKRENIVVDLTNLYDHFFVSSGECKAKVTAARLPYFDGDYWPGAAEDIINQLRQEEDGRKQQKKGKTKKTITKRALKAAAQADLSSNASKDALLMQKLGETISPMKEDFIMVHLQYPCSHCCHLIVSGRRWTCSRQCKNFQLCDKCYEAEQNREERDRHPMNSREKHILNPIEVNGIPTDTKDKDEILESEFFDTRQAFLSLCQGNHYQYDTLRRAKHSSMMVLYHLHNPTAPAFVTTCNICHQDIETGQGWRCETCPDYDVCNACYQKDGGIDHPHKLTSPPSTADRDAQNKEARQKRVLQLRKMLDLLVHASQCRSAQCLYPNCRKVKGLFRHGSLCKVRASGGCQLCKKMWYLLQLHARACKESECHVPRCKDLKEHLRRSQQQSDSRRRAAVMEMMRQRAAEVAGNTG